MQIIPTKVKEFAQAGYYIVKRYPKTTLIVLGTAASIINPWVAVPLTVAGLVVNEIRGDNKRTEIKTPTPLTFAAIVAGGGLLALSYVGFVLANHNWYDENLAKAKEQIVQACPHLGEGGRDPNGHYDWKAVEESLTKIKNSSDGEVAVDIGYDVSRKSFFTLRNYTTRRFAQERFSRVGGVCKP